jgi:hypothetical protein
MDANEKKRDCVHCVKQHKIALSRERFFDQHNGNVMWKMRIDLRLQSSDNETHGNEFECLS